MRTLLALLIVALVAGCASQPKIHSSNYERDLIAPNETENFIQVEKTIYPQPQYGVGMSYANKRHPSDHTTVYIYPIPSIDWSDNEATLAKEMKPVLTEVDAMVSHGRYDSATAAAESPFIFTANEQTYNGLKAHFSFTTQQRAYDSDAYLFIQKDKFIKFRVSFDSELTANWNGDAAVKELLPLITVPDESPWMRENREHHREQIQKQFIDALNKAIQKQKAEEPETL